MSKTLERLGGDEKLLHEVIGIFLEEVPQHLAGLEQAIAQGDARAVEEIAHKLKGELG
jgi:HPt (histidine-containing phosphotransfer) domain-containing protein